MVRRDYASLLREINIRQRSRKGTFECVLEMLEGLPGRRVLDAPCGPGLLSQALRHLGYQVTSADFDTGAFEPQDTTSFLQLDLDDPLPFVDGSFDTVICGDGIEHLENPFALLREFARVLDEGGTIIIATPNYLNMERRVRFLFTGSLTKSLPRQPGFTTGSKFDRGHINPITLTRLAYMAECAGLDLVRAFTLLSKPRQNVLAPLAWLVSLYWAFMPERYRYNLWVSHTNSYRMLLGGKKVIAEFKKGVRRDGEHPPRE
jgi:SAM-dependent methyltransferase